MAVSYYYHYIETIERVIPELPVDALVVEELQQMTADQMRHLKSDIIFVHTNYSFIVQKIEILEKSTLSLEESLRHLDESIEKVNHIGCRTGQIISEHFRKIVTKNPDLNLIKSMNRILCGKSCEEVLSIPTENVGYYKFCNLTSVDTERSFSRYKLLIDDRRHFKFENLRKYFFFNCNAYFDE